MKVANKCLDLVKHSYKTSYSTAKEYMCKYILKIKPIIITENNYNIFYNPEWKYWLKVMYNWISDQWSVLSRKKRKRERRKRHQRNQKIESTKTQTFPLYVGSYKGLNPERRRKWTQKEFWDVRRNSNQMSS